MAEPSKKQEFECPTCQGQVTYDPDDPMHRLEGALLRTKEVRTDIVVYLTCSAGHVRRYVVR